MTITLLIIFTIINQCSSSLVALKQWNSNAAHSSIVISVNIYNDNTKFVSGSNDNTVKIWSMTTYELLHTQTFGNYITHISLHPVDNRIFILVFDGTIKVLDPNNYAALHTATYPTAFGNGNFLRFFSSNSKYIMSGYDVSNPIFHIFDATSYASIAGGATTTFFAGDETTVISTSYDSKIVAAISNANAAPISIQLYDLTTNTLSQTFLDNSQLLKWILFNSTSNEFYVTSNDMTLKSYRKNPLNGQYDIYYSYSTYQFGYPNCINANINNTLIISANASIIFLNTSKNYPQLISTSKDQADIFVLDVSVDGKYLVSGMRYGEITLWQIGATKTKKDQDISLLIYLGAGIGGLILIIVVGIIIYKFCCNQGGAKISQQNNEEKGKKKKINVEKTLQNINHHDRSLELP